MKVLSLFDGMACGRIALERAGIPVEEYHASEIDTWAMQIAQKNYPDIVQIGDVCEVDGTKYRDFDMLIGGSPCQGFSFAGKQLNFDDPRSALFFEYVRILKEMEPEYFLLENVVMKKEYQDVISRELGVRPVMINSALVSAQTRKRLYWTNIHGIRQPEDKGILLKDIIEDAVTEKDKSYAIDAHYGNGTNLEYYQKRNKRQIVFTDKYHQANVRGLDEKSKTLLSSMWKGKGYNSQQDRAFYPDGKHGSVPTCHTDGKCNVFLGETDDAIIYRKLTPIECERLQTVPDNYTEGVSNTQRYRMLGNGWTVDVIAHIFRHLPECNQQPETNQTRLFGDVE